METDKVPAVIIFAPVLGDSATLRALIEVEQVGVLLCRDKNEFYALLNDSTLAAAVTEEGLAQCSLDELSECLRRQPTWSDIPMLLLADAENRNIDTGRFARLSEIGNFTVLTRPATRLAIVMALRSALRTRRLQFDLRDQLHEMTDHAQQLESLVGERTARLEQEVLGRRRVEHALVEARRLESLGRLTGGIAHDFNNILQVIAGSETLLRMLLGGAVDPRLSRSLDGIRRATTHGATLTQQLLAYARRQPLASIVIDMQVHMDSSLELLQRMLPSSVQVSLKIAPHIWSVLADPTQLDAALLNIASNARDAMDDVGTIAMDSANWTLPDPMMPEAAHLVGEFVGILLTDSGPGMSGDTAEQAFEPFFTTKAVGKGTGLGLSQVYGFAVQSNGTAFIRRENAGLTVGILLPRSQEKIVLVELNTLEKRSDGLAGLNILYVEDNPDVAESTVALLQSLGAIVYHVYNADTARESDLSAIDLVFSDVMMPGKMDGVEFARWLATGHPNLAVVLTSGFMLSPERLHGLDVQFVRKPFVIQTINEAILQAIRKNAQGKRRSID
ncbi:signal transduction histidine kinase/CheY-like chemotaxis protein [Massilia aurea]|uniref:histidine kinase n=1 Tax=Massilia aurea TaxID=373040 RepID=A0A7W9WW11_9BURK|nr:response regulator [Massilia aurea]MBB6132664.1 signal transduction histidine kinase/CheY-like chemotaxis protein [Massilia aurea]